MMVADNKVEWHSAGGTGHLLRAAREARNLSTLQVAGKLRLDVKHIEAMERDEFASLVAPVFARGYLQSYARFLELSPEVIVKSYENNKGPLPKVLHGRSVLSDVGSDDSDRAMTWVVYLIVLASLILGVVWWQTQGTFRFAQNESVMNFESDSLQPLSETQESATSVAGINASVVPAPNAPEIVASPASAQASSTAPTQIAPMPSAVASAKADGNLSSAPVAVPGQITATGKPVDVQIQQQTPATQQPVAQAAADSAVTITTPFVVLTLTADSWVDIKDSTGKQLVYKLLPAGSSQTLQDLKFPIKVVLGNAAGVTLEYNGQPFDHSRYSRNGVTRFELGSAQLSTAQ